MPWCGTLHSLPLFPLNDHLLSYNILHYYILYTTPWFISRTIQIMSIIDMEGGNMPDGENKQTTQESNGSQTTQQESSTNSNTEQSTSTGNGNQTGQANTEQIDLAKISDMLKEKDDKVDALSKQVEDLKKANTELLLKVNTGAGKPPEDPFKVLYDEVVNHM